MQHTKSPRVELTELDEQLLQRLVEAEAPLTAKGLTRLPFGKRKRPLTTVISALKKLAKAGFLETRPERRGKDRSRDAYLPHPLVRELLELSFAAGCEILRETLLLEHKYPKGPWRAFFASAVKLYEFGNRVILQTDKGSGIDKCVRFFHLQWAPGPSLPTNNRVPSKTTPLSLEDAVGPGPYQFLDGREMSPIEIEHRISDLAYSVTTYLGDIKGKPWIMKLEKPAEGS